MNTLLLFQLSLAIVPDENDIVMMTSYYIDTIGRSDASYNSGFIGQQLSKLGYQKEQKVNSKQRAIHIYSPYWYLFYEGNYNNLPVSNINFFFKESVSFSPERIEDLHLTTYRMSKHKIKVTNFNPKQKLIINEIISPSKYILVPTIDMTMLECGQFFSFYVYICATDISLVSQTIFLATNIGEIPYSITYMAHYNNQIDNARNQLVRHLYVNANSTFPLVIPNGTISSPQFSIIYDSNLFFQNDRGVQKSVILFRTKSQNTKPGLYLTFFHSNKNHYYINYPTYILVSFKPLQCTVPTVFIETITVKDKVVRVPVKLVNPTNTNFVITSVSMTKDSRIDFGTQQPPVVCPRYSTTQLCAVIVRGSYEGPISAKVHVSFEGEGGISYNLDIPVVGSVNFGSLEADPVLYLTPKSKISGKVTLKNNFKEVIGIFGVRSNYGIVPNEFKPFALKSGESCDMFFRLDSELYKKIDNSSVTFLTNITSLVIKTKVVISDFTILPPLDENNDTATLEKSKDSNGESFLNGNMQFNDKGVFIQEHSRKLRYDAGYVFTKSIEEIHFRLRSDFEFPLQIKSVIDQNVKVLDFYYEGEFLEPHTEIDCTLKVEYLPCTDIARNDRIEFSTGKNVVMLEISWFPVLGDIVFSGTQTHLQYGNSYSVNISIKSNYQLALMLKGLTADNSKIEATFFGPNFIPQFSDHIPIANFKFIANISYLEPSEGELTQELLEDPNFWKATETGIYLNIYGKIKLKRNRYIKFVLPFMVHYFRFNNIIHTVGKITAGEIVKTQIEIFLPIREPLTLTIGGYIGKFENTQGKTGEAKFTILESTKPRSFILYPQSSVSIPITFIVETLDKVDIILDISTSASPDFLIVVSALVNPPHLMLFKPGTSEGVKSIVFNASLHQKLPWTVEYELQNMHYDVVEVTSAECPGLGPENFEISLIQQSLHPGERTTTVAVLKGIPDRLQTFPLSLVLKSGERVSLEIYIEVAPESSFSEKFMLMLSMFAVAVTIPTLGYYYIKQLRRWARKRGVKRVLNIAEVNILNNNKLKAEINRNSRKQGQRQSYKSDCAEITSNEPPCFADRGIQHPGKREGRASRKGWSAIQGGSQQPSREALAVLAAFVSDLSSS